MARFKPITELVYMPGALLIIEDMEWWRGTTTTVLHWTIDTIGIHNLKQKGNILIFKTPEDRTAFLLRWGV